MACKIAAMNLSLSIPNIQSFVEALSGGGYIFDLLERKSNIDASVIAPAEPLTITGDIEFKNVDFTYPTRQNVPILRNISLKIPSGKTVALIGASGCGKSTIIQLIQRFYDVDNGKILLDGKDIRIVNVGSLRQRIGIVSQEPVLFSGTIEDNIRLSNPNATEEQIVEAAKMANAHDFIMLLPKNYQTRISEKLSGGQKQRVAIARALVSKPQILLLDEATSALDNKTECIVQDALDKAKIGRTTIIIAHRLHTIRNVDLIIGLEHGQVVECGTHEELMEHKGLYYEMVTTQQQNEKEEESEEISNDKEEYSDDVKPSVRETSEINRKTSKYSIDSLEEIEQNNDKETELNRSEKKHKKWLDISFLLSILKLNASEWYWMLTVIFSCIIFGAIQIAAPFILAQIYELFAEPNIDKQKYWTNIYAVIIFIMGVVSALVEFINSIAFAKSGEAFAMRMRNLAFTSILRQDMEYFDDETNSPESLATRLSQESAALKGLSGIRIGKILEALIISIGAIVVSFCFGWKLTFVIICLAPLITLSGKLLNQKNIQTVQTKAKHLPNGNGEEYANQAIEHIRTVVALHQEEHFFNLYTNQYDQQFKKQICRLYVSALGTSIALSMPFFINCVAFSYGSKLVQNNEMTFADVFRVYFVLNFSMQAVGRSIGGLPDYIKAKQAALGILQLSKRRSNIDPNDNSGKKLEEVKGDIEFQNVYFRYPAQPTIRVLKDFSLKCTSSKTTALVGPSGSGKSTLIKLIQRFYQPLKGKILLDGHDISELNIQWLRSLMGLVQQEPVLFNLSIRENITYGDNSRYISDAEIEKAARDANIHDFIAQLPKGYETLCGAKGSQLSGGQKQRIAIARALIRQPKILLLDEATSALDNKSEKLVQETLEKAKIGRTCLQIAHRLSTIQNSDKIVVIDHGRVKEQGTHDDLLQMNGIYSQLALIYETST
ncbi:unnamed protein product [Adineta ricciae]|nr:unnamed protein product [Adineta ricciae]